MLIYIFLFLSVTLFSYLEMTHNEITLLGHKYNTRKVAIIYLGLLFLFIGVMRHDLLGPDSYNYHDYFNLWVDTLSWEYLFTHFLLDNGYYAFNKFVRLFVQDFWVFKSILYIITFTIYYYVIIKNSKNVSLSLLVFLGIERLIGIFCLLRQEVAIAICFYSIKYIKEKKLIPFIICILIALTFHKTAIFFVLAYIFVNHVDDELHFTIKWKGILKEINFTKYTGLFLLSILSIVLLPIMICLYPIDYTNGIVFGQGTFKLCVIIFNILLANCILILGNKFSDKGKLLYDITFCSLVPQIVTLCFPVFTRVTSYFYIFLCLLIPELLGNKMKYNKYLLLYCCTVFGFLFFYSIQGNIVPYVFKFF